MELRTGKILDRWLSPLCRLRAGWSTGAFQSKRSPFRPQVAVEEGQSGIPGEDRLTAVAEVEDVAGAGDNEELDRPPELGEPLRQAAGLLDASRVVAVAVHEETES